MQQQWAFATMPLRGLRLDAPLAALRGDAMRALMLGCAAIDTTYRCLSGNGTHMRRRQRRKTMPFREWHSYASSTTPQDDAISGMALICGVDVALGRYRPQLIGRLPGVTKIVLASHIQGTTQIDAISGLAFECVVGNTPMRCHFGIGINLRAPAGVSDGLDRFEVGGVSELAVLPKGGRPEKLGGTACATPPYKPEGFLSGTIVP